MTAPAGPTRPGRGEVSQDPGNGATPTLTSPTLPWNHAMYQQAANFVAAIKGEIAPLCTAQEAILDLKNAQEYMAVKGK